MNKEKRAKIIIAVVIVTCLVVPLAYVIYYQVLIDWETPPETPPLPTIIFTMDKNNGTLTVKTIEPTTVNWANLKIGPGIATLPSGTIKPGDIITNCSGRLILYYSPTNQKFGEWDFS